MENERNTQDSSLMIRKVPVKASVGLFEELENRKILRRFIGGWEYPETDPAGYAVETLYTTDACFGGHKLIHVTYNMSEVQLGYHQENEDFILIKSPKRVQKPLYLVLSLCSCKELQKKIDENKFSSDDVVLIELAFNDPLLSFFTLSKGYPHCELTCEGAHAPSFFVTEPASMGTIAIDVRQYQIVLAE